MMQTTDVTQHAHALFRSHGHRAEAEAAQRERAAAEKGKTALAEDWRRIRASIRQLRGANQG